MNDQTEQQILNNVRMSGPVLPLQIAKAIGKDLLFSGAILSQLVSKKMISISYAKIGGSPVYYFKGQEPKLSMLYSNLPLKEKEAYNLLKEKKILMDSKQEPSIRVALRNLKDFASPFKANIGEKEELFWKWYVATDNEINALFGNKEEQEKIAKPEVKVEKPEIKTIEKPKKEEKKVEQKKIEIKQKRLEVEDDFLKNISAYLETNKIEVLEEQIIKKKKEIDMVVKVPSNMGELYYFVAARNKKNVSDGDVSLAYHKGQEKKLPVLFLSPGKLSKKAEGYINNNLKGFLVFKRLE